MSLLALHMLASGKPCLTVPLLYSLPFWFCYRAHVLYVISQLCVISGDYDDVRNEVRSG